jgi:hypothetical protein
MSLMYISLLVHFVEQSNFFLSSAVLPHPTYTVAAVYAYIADSG